MCLALNTLPGPGGLLQQDAYLMKGMQLILVMRQQKADRERGPKK